MTNRTYALHTDSRFAVVRREAHESISGRALFVADLPLSGDRLGGTVRFRITNGRSIGSRFDPSFDWSRVVVVTAADIPGANVDVCHGFDQSSPCESVIRHVYDSVILVAAANAHTLAEALAAIEPFEESRPAVIDLQEAVKATETIYGNDNISLEIPILKDDPKAAMDQGLAEVEVDTPTEKRPSPPCTRRPTWAASSIRRSPPAKPEGAWLRDWAGP